MPLPCIRFRPFPTSAKDNWSLRVTVWSQDNHAGRNKWRYRGQSTPAGDNRRHLDP